jgi:hypothetical protein
MANTHSSLRVTLLVLSAFYSVISREKRHRIYIVNVFHMRVFFFVIFLLIS